MKSEGPAWRRLSGRGHSALQVYELSGAADLLPQFFRAGRAETGMLRFGHILADGAVLDEVMLAGPDHAGRIEVSLHGSPAVGRAFELLLGVMGIERMAVAASIEEECLALARSAFAQRTLELACGPALHLLREQLRALAAGAPPERLEWAAGLRAAAGRLPLGLALSKGCVVLLCGAPNAGKSTLFNALAGRDAAIVSDEAGTTRDVLDAQIAVGGWPFLLRDAAGLRPAGDPVEALAVGMTRAAWKSADILLVLDAPDARADMVLSELQGDERVLLLASKSDLGAARGLPLAAMRGEGLPLLERALIQHSPFAAWQAADRLPPCAFTLRQQRLLAGLADALTREPPEPERIRSLARELGP